MKRSLMHYAAMGNCPELLRYLLLNNAAVDARDRNNRTPLSLAAEHYSLDTVKILQYVAKPVQLIYSPINFSAACAETH